MAHLLANDSPSHPTHRELHIECSVAMVTGPSTVSIVVEILLMKGKDFKRNLSYYTQYQAIVVLYQYTMYTCVCVFILGRNEFNCQFELRVVPTRPRTFFERLLGTISQGKITRV